MKPTIETLALAICTACMRINAAGKLYAFFEVTPHVEWITVQIIQRPSYDIHEALLSVDASYSDDDRQATPAKQRAVPIKELTELLTAVEAYLPENYQPEAAA